MVLGSIGMEQRLSPAVDLPVPYKARATWLLPGLCLQTAAAATGSSFIDIHGYRPEDSRSTEPPPIKQSPTVSPRPRHIELSLKAFAARRKKRREEEGKTGASAGMSVEAPCYGGGTCGGYGSC